MDLPRKGTGNIRSLLFRLRARQNTSNEHIHLSDSTHPAGLQLRSTQCFMLKKDTCLTSNFVDPKKLEIHTEVKQHHCGNSDLFGITASSLLWQSLLSSCKGRPESNHLKHLELPLYACKDMPPIFSVMHFSCLIGRPPFQSPSNAT